MSTPSIEWPSISFGPVNLWNCPHWDPHGQREELPKLTTGLLNRLKSEKAARANLVQDRYRSASHWG